MSIQNTINNQNNGNEIKEEFPEELICAIQLHFNKKIPIEIIKETLKEYNNDLFLSLKHFYQQTLNSQFIEE